MMTLAAALLFAVQDEGRLKEAWPKLSEAWKAVEAYKPTSGTGGIDDEILKLAGTIHQAFEAGGLYGSDGEYVPLALKVFIKHRASGLTRGGSHRAVFRADPAAEFATSLNQYGGASDPMRAFLAAMTRLRTLEKSGLDDEDNVQDELAVARRALKALGVTADATPAPLRRRVLVLCRALAEGAPWPEPAQATEEQAKQIRDRIAELGHESIEARDKAVRELSRIGEAAFPFLREAVKSPDAETAARARQLLGIGHAPWAATQGIGAADDKLRALDELKIKEEIDRRVRNATDKARERK